MTPIRGEHVVVRRNAAATPAAIASWPIERWLVPLTRFWRKRSYASFSKYRTRTWAWYISPRNSREAGPVASPVTGSAALLMASLTPPLVARYPGRHVLETSQRTRGATILPLPVTPRNMTNIEQ